MNANNRQRYIILGASTLVLLLIIALIFFGFRTVLNRGPSGGGEVDDIVAAPPTATATPFPTLTPTPTNTPIPTETPLPSPTPLPEPMTFTITGPKTIQAGLPKQVDWTIEATGGEGLATVILEDLGGAMLIGDEAGNVIIARTISDEFTDSTIANYGESFVLSAVVDPNVREGVVSFEIRNSLFTEPVFIPWLSSDSPDPEIWSFDLTLDGEQEEIILSSIAQSDDTEEDGRTTQTDSEQAENTADNETEDETTETTDGSSNPEDEGSEEDPAEDPLLENTEETDEDGDATGREQTAAGSFQSFVGDNGVTLDFPAEWFISEQQDGIIDLSTSVINSEEIPIPGENIFATVFSGPAADYGIATGQEVTPASIKQLLLGNIIQSGIGEDAILLTETGLEVILEQDLELPDGYLGSITRLKTPDDFDTSGSNGFASLFAVVTNGTDVIVMNGYTLLEQLDQLDSMERIAESMRLVESE